MPEIDNKKSSEEKQAHFSLECEHPSCVTGRGARGARKQTLITATVLPERVGTLCVSKGV